MNNSIARFQISADEDFRIQFVFVGLSLTGRDLRILVKERSSNVTRATLTLGAGLTLDGTDTVTALVLQETAAAWAKGEFETDLHDITDGANLRLVGARTIYDVPGRLPYGVIGAKATVQWVVNKAIVTAIGGIGPTGPANALTIGDVETLETGESATAEITGTAPNQELHLGLPKGGTGDTGPAGTITIGDVVTGAPGSEVAVSNSGTPENAVLNFSIPRGDEGGQGETGEKGWSPLLAVVPDGARRVHQIVDWANGEGTKPAAGDYLGEEGPVSDIAEATDIRGPAGGALAPEDFASQAEAEEGTDNERVMTPLRTAQHVDARIGTEPLALVALDEDGKLPAVSGEHLTDVPRALGELSDVDLSTPPSDGDGVVWDADAEKFKPGPAGGGMFKGDNGTVGNRKGDIFRVSEQQLDADVTIATGENAYAPGPLTIADGATLTIEAGANLVIL
jgi:hypothetical protein